MEKDKIYVNGKRRILVADDELINREMLEAILKDDYEVIKAEDGAVAYDIIKENKNTLSLILLDLIMPNLNGLDLLSKLKQDPEFKSIPVIVLTSNQESEVESLHKGAADFIPKPYPQPDVIKARVRRSIELAEDRQIINATATDHLTGLYTTEYFYRYGDQLDKYLPDVCMDALCIDINHFHVINERFGMAQGDKILKAIADCLVEVFPYDDSIICRKSADTFLVYCPHQDDYQLIVDKASATVNDAATSIKLRIGVYSECDKKLDIQSRFDRAKMAADKIRNNYTVSISKFDESLMESEVFAENLVEQFPKAIAEGQFQVYYQPKFNITGDKPVLSSAEALIRWVHPESGMISPGAFIPLFEENGLITELDTYVWKSVAAQIAEWKKTLGYSVPVSVNLSRAEMYDPKLVDKLDALISDNGLTTNDIYLEITESAYVRDSSTITDVVAQLQEHGFFIEMDDFGSGYSSLNMISELPIDALKLDMYFIKNAFSKSHNTKMISIVIEIADYLGVPLIAEGVETEEQYLTMKELGCAVIQGYYFSKPIPASEFEKFLIAKGEQG